MTGGKTATDIRVHEYRQILIWPFRLEGKETDPKKLRDAARNALTSDGWRREAPLRHLLNEGEQPGKYEYQEYVYFYPFVRDFLYGVEKPSDEIILMRRSDLTGLRTEFSINATENFSVEFSVERVNLYLFDAGVAVLALELLNGGDVRSGGERADMSLFHVQIIQERLRRAYPPFWYSETAPGLFPKSVRWLRNGERCGAAAHPPPTQADMVRMTCDKGEPPPAGHWRELLASLLPTDKRLVHLRQVVDERIPLMLYLRVDDPRHISRGDWVRLAVCDDPGNGELPYGRDFLADFEQRHCYDRFWRGCRGDDDTALSRYLFSGYGFVAVGGEKNDFFKDPLPEHFRRHYFQLGLLAHFEYAALLAESHRLADAEGREVDAALKRVLSFTQKYWFVDVSNQVQAREMFALWRKHLNTEALYKQVLEEARAVADYEEAKEARRSADAVTRLTVAALLVAVPTLATGFLGMNVLVEAKEGADAPIPPWGVDDWTIVLWALFLAATVVGVSAFVGWGYLRFPGWVKRCLGPVAALIAFIAMVIGLYPG